MYETKNIRLSLHLLKKTNIVGPSGPTQTKHKRRKKMKKKHKEINPNAPTVYVFYNKLFDFHMFINANGAEEAQEKFDQCGFKHRSQWTIFCEIGEQPSDGPDGE